MHGCRISSLVWSIRGATGGIQQCRVVESAALLGITFCGCGGADGSAGARAADVATAAAIAAAALPP